jgi:leader peptidase (prepilin peptidase) / N-methyltransferase
LGVSANTVLALLVAPFVGSFLGVVIERLPAGRPIVFARSACAHCGATLGARDMIPLLTWLARRGRCGCGRIRLNAFYPGIELAALAVAASAVPVLSGWLLWVSLALGWTLLALAAIDVRHYLLPDALTLPLIPAGLAVAWAVDPARLGDHLIGAAAGGLGFALIAWLYRRLRNREGLGLGDAKLLAGGGAWLGWQAVPSIVALAAFVALAAALAGARAGAKIGATTRIAFGPYLALAIWVVWLYGPLVPI